MMKIYIEKPTIWFYTQFDGHRNRLMYENLFSTLKTLDIEIQEEATDIFRDFNIRDSPEDGIRISYHSVGNVPYVWRLKETSIPFYYAVDRLGYSGWSELCQNHTKQFHETKINAIDALKAEKFCIEIKSWLTSNNLSKYDQSNSHFDFSNRFVLYPMQVTSDQVATHHQLSPIKVLFLAAKYAKRHKKHLIVKRHPFCKSKVVGATIKLLSISNKYFKSSTASITKLLDSCDSVIVGNSGTGLEALIYGKPVYSFSKSEYEIATTKISTKGDIEDIFRKPHEMEKAISLGYKFIDYYLNEICFDARYFDSIMKRLLQIIEERKNSKWIT